MRPAEGADTQATHAREARALLAAASSATLLTRECHRAPALPARVRLEEQDGGRPLVVADAGSPVVARLQRSPVATLVVPGHDGGPALHVVASYRPVPCERPGARVFRPTLLFVCVVGRERRAVPVEDFTAAELDPFAAAPRLLRHWGARHRPELADALPVEPAAGSVLVASAVDRDALTVQVLDAEGVRSHRLPHPGGPVVRLADAAAAHGLPIR